MGSRLFAIYLVIFMMDLSKFQRKMAKLIQKMKKNLNQLLLKQVTFETPSPSISSELKKQQKTQKKLQTLSATDEKKIHANQIKSYVV